MVVVRDFSEARRLELLAECERLESVALEGLGVPDGGFYEGLVGDLPSRGELARMGGRRLREEVEQMFARVREADASYGARLSVLAGRLRGFRECIDVMAQEISPSGEGGSFSEGWQERVNVTLGRYERLKEFVDKAIDEDGVTFEDIEVFGGGAQEFLSYVISSKVDYLASVVPLTEYDVGSIEIPLGLNTVLRYEVTGKVGSSSAPFRVRLAKEAGRFKSISGGSDLGRFTIDGKGLTGSTRGGSARLGGDGSLGEFTLDGPSVPVEGYEIRPNGEPVTIGDVTYQITGGFENVDGHDLTARRFWFSESVDSPVATQVVTIESSLDEDFRKRFVTNGVPSYVPVTAPVVEEPVLAPVGEFFSSVGSFIDSIVADVEKALPEGTPHGVVIGVVVVVVVVVFIFSTFSNVVTG